MKVIQQVIPDVLVIEPQVFGDARGFFIESFKESWYHDLGLPHRFIQDNHSRSRQWTLRGMHYQLAHTQGKLVRCSLGRVFDVVVDLRRSSPTFGAWSGVELDDTHHRMLWVPPGLAHGFLVLSELADLQYKVTDRYDPASERTIAWNDATIEIDWPLPPGVTPTLSEKDRDATAFQHAEVFA
jgi:dTDP-4-dehydrorhamnose 3,5-epimerase